MWCLHPTFESRLNGRSFSSEGTIQATPLTQRYLVRVVYDGQDLPRVYVLDPRLRRRHPTQPIAHTYSDTEPCLFTAARGDWDPSMYLGQTIVPWLMEWDRFLRNMAIDGGVAGRRFAPADYNNPPEYNQPAA